MSEVQYLEMPQGKQGGKMSGLLRGRGPVVVAAVLLVALVALASWWLASGRVDSLHAQLDGNVFMVTPQVSGTLAEISVAEGDHVRAGQPVGRVDISGYDRHVRQAGQEIAALRMPGMEEMAGRVRQAQEAERDMVTRLAQARHDEEIKQRVRDEAVMAHVQAQLAMRGLQPQPNGKMDSRYANAQRAEQAARQRMEQAKADFEQVSRVRAAISGELQRVRDEIMMAKQLAARQRFAPYRDGMGSAPRSNPRSYPASAPAADGTLYAPVDGTIVKSRVATGQLVQNGDAVLLLAPDQAGDVSGLWAVAYYPLEYRTRIQVGQAATVRTQNGGGSVGGVVTEVGQPQAMPGSFGAGQVLPVRISLAAIPEGLMPGDVADCTVRTRSILGFSGF